MCLELSGGQGTLGAMTQRGGHDPDQGGGHGR